MEKGTLVQFVDHEGYSQSGHIENINEDHAIYRVRTSKGTLYNVNFEDAFEKIEVQPEVKQEIQQTKLEYYKQFAKDNWKRYAKYTAFMLFLLLIGMNAIYRHNNRTELEKLTDQLNKINEQKVPLMEACSQLKQKDSEVSIILNKIGQWGQ